jgi:hypothetical protein
MMGRRIRWARYVGHTRQSIDASKILIRKPKRKGLYGGPRSGWEDNIKINLKEIGLENVEWIHLAQYRIRTL